MLYMRAKKSKSATLVIATALAFLGLLLCVSAPRTKAQTTPQLVAAYSFNEGSGTTVTGASGYGNTGTVQHAVWTSAGKHGNALYFDGTSAMVTISNAPSLDLTTGVTLEAWVNPSMITGGWEDVIYKGRDNYFLEASGGPGPAGGGTMGGSDVTTGSNALTANKWTHLAVTYNGATMTLYVNGVAVSRLAHY
jgi:hypothetical protein